MTDSADTPPGRAAQGRRAILASLLPGSVRKAAEYEHELAKVVQLCLREGHALELVIDEIRRRAAETTMAPVDAARSVFDDLAAARWLP